MVNYRALRTNELQFIAITGLRIASFDILYSFYATSWNEYISHYTIDGKVRRRPHKPRKDSAFTDVESMLIFILSYLKNNPLQQTHAALFGLTQPQANRWIHLTREILLTSLKDADCLPCRDIESFNKLLKQGQDILMDGSERPIPRPADKEVQKEYYSGKKTSYDQEFNN
ncbi:MAG: transposase family protein [Prevotella sp.]|jgi:hypothetical protein|nr:transposase family protein [Prevotella sp.]